MTTPGDPLAAFAPALAGKRVFVTGGTGFFGRSLIDLLARGALPETEWVLLSRDPAAFRARCPEAAALPQVRLLRGDVRDFSLADAACDLIWHGAAPAVLGLPRGEMASIVEDGTRRVLELARRCGAERLLFISSGAVYGPQPPEMTHLPEEYEGEPVTEYGRAKKRAERLSLDSGVPTVIARGFAFLGRHLNRNIHFAAGNFLRDALAGGPVTVEGDGTPIRSYLYADDLVEWLLAALLRGRPGEAYNIGSEETVTIRELAEKVAAILGGGPVVVRRAPVRGALPERYVPFTAKARRELGVDVRVPLEAAIRLSAR